MCNKLLAIDEDISIVYRSKREIARNGNFAWKRIYYKIPANESIARRISRVNCISPAI